MLSLPIECLLVDRPVVVVGADRHAYRKTQECLAAGARVQLFLAEQEADDSFEILAHDGRVVVAEGEPAVADLQQGLLVFVSPGQHELAHRMHAWALEHGKLLCVLDSPECSTAMSPATTKVGGVGLRFFSGGRLPGLMRRMREDFETALSGPVWKAFVRRLTRLQADPTIGEQARLLRMRAALKGFGLRIQVVYPAWFTEGMVGPKERERSPSQPA